MSEIAIIGTGLMAKALGLGWFRAGHSIRIGSRTPAEVTSESLGYEPSLVGDYPTVLDGSEIVVLAMPFPAVVPFVTEHRGLLRDKVIVDISNPFDALPNNERAGAEYTADALGTTKNLVAAFKDNFAATINAAPAADGSRGDVKIAADDDAAKDVVASLARELDHRALDCGPLHNARLIDPMVALMLHLDRTYQKFTRRTGWRFTGLEQ
jgi:hypothetical protein